MFSNLIRFGVLCSLFAFHPKSIVIDELVTFYFLVLIVCFSFFAKKIREVDMRLPGLFFLASFLSLVFNFKWPVRAVFINLFVGILAVKSISEHYDFDREKTALWLFWFCLINDVLIGFQYFKFDRIFTPIYPEIAGAMWMPWILGCAAVLSIPFLTAISKWDVIIILPMLFFSHSKVCVLVALIVFCIATGVKFRFRYIGFAVVAILAYIVFFDSDFDTARFEAWSRSLRYLHNPFIGNGIGAWAHEGFAKMNGADAYHWRWAHNELFQGLFETGILGAVSLIALIGSWFSRDRVKLSIIVGVLLLSLFHPIFHFGKLLGLIVLCVAWLTPKTELAPLSPDARSTTSPQ